MAAPDPKQPFTARYAPKQVADQTGVFIPERLPGRLGRPGQPLL